jgi:hypothetical protein
MFCRKVLSVVVVFFREVLSVSKRLAQEREEMCREVARLQESVLDH